VNIRERLEAFWAGERPDMIPLQKSVQPRISRIDTNFLSGTSKAIREIGGKKSFSPWIHQYFSIDHSEVH